MLLFKVEGKYSSLFNSAQKSSIDFFDFDKNFEPDWTNNLKKEINFALIESQYLKYAEYSFIS